MTLDINGKNTPMIVFKGTLWSNLPHSNIIKATLNAYDKHPDFGGTAFVEGIDFTVDYTNGRIARIPSGRIPDWNTKPDANWTNLDVASNTSVGNTGKPYGVWFTYQTNNNPDIIPKNEKLTRLADKVRNGTSVNITILGDSISYGMDAHLTGSLEAHAFWSVLAKKIEDQHPNIKTVNVNRQAIGGTLSSDIADDSKLAARVLNNPDLVTIGYGMNDQGSLTASAYASNIEHGVLWIRNNFPNADIILISSMTPNYNSVIYGGGSFQHLISDYKAQLNLIASKYDNVAVADVTSTWIQEESRLGNGVYSNDLNHPTSYGQAVIYADVLESFLPNGNAPQSRLSNYGFAYGNVYGAGGFNVKIKVGNDLKESMGGYIKVGTELRNVNQVFVKVGNSLVSAY